MLDDETTQPEVVEEPRSDEKRSHKKKPVYSTSEIESRYQAHLARIEGGN